MTSRARRLVLAVLTAVVAAGALTGCGFRGLYGVTLPGGADLGNHPYRVTVQFANVLDLVTQSAVKVNDVSVGRVEKIELSDWHATVTVAVNGDVALPANARAEIGQTSLLGEKYVSLEQPDDAAPTGRLADGADIPLSRTGANAQVEEVLGALSLLLNGGGLQQIATITTELNRTLGGNTEQIRDLFGQLNSTITTLNAQRDTITTAIDKLNTLAATLDAQKQVLVATLDSLPQALSVLAGEKDDLVALLSSLDDLSGVAVSTINGSTANLVSTLQSLRPTLENLTKAGSDLGNGFELLGTFPFPRQATAAIGGDFTNLDITGLNIDLGSTLSTVCSSAGLTGCDDLLGLIPIPVDLPVALTATQSARSAEVPVVPGAGP